MDTTQSNTNPGNERERNFVSRINLSEICYTSKIVSY